MFFVVQRGKTGKVEPRKETRDKNSALQKTLVIYSINGSRDYRRVKKKLTGWRIRAKNCKVSAFNGTARSEARRRMEFRAGKE